MAGSTLEQEQVEELRERWARLEARLGFQFSDPRLRRQAFTHPSWANERPETESADNQRLEYLGDAVLGLVIADGLYRRYPDLPEGRLSRLKSALVCETTLADVAVELDVEELLLLGRGERVTGGHQKPSILADAVEALFGAIYLDSGYAIAQQVIEGLFRTRFAEAFRGRLVRDHKTALQEYVQAQGKAPPDYLVTHQVGPPHSQRFTVEVAIDGRTIGEGKGSSKKAAQKNAAAMALSQLLREEGLDEPE